MFQCDFWSARRHCNHQRL